MSTLRFLVLAGPTAVGKTEFAVEIAERLQTEIVGADAFQIYQGFQILSGKPSIVLDARVKHHLIGVLPVSESCDAARYVELATEKIRALNQRGVIPLLVGGSGFYIGALLNPLPELPGGDSELRSHIADQSLSSLLSELKERDPEAFEKIDQHNRRRIERAIEVIRLTGKPFSGFRRSNPSSEQIPGLVLTRPRAALHHRINERVRWMLENGAIQEVASASELSPTAAQMIGIPEIRQFLRQEIPFHECTQAMQAATRHYAKRQITWFKKQPFVPFDAEASVQEATDFFKRHEW